ncbi:PREDICTED: unknown [Prunus dulcis]|uniref:Uncharacterized protein n=1 Tax=Prunus dulcis TaxID=3755 RepID=A0A5E4EFP1_PRUDU|nr:uncharacterized protein LOC117631673 [Prunus dulcis]KAI5326187.1 hypothetical protein L3X38_035261 [Prunus dulcis]VVA14514.1 PREDICTED: unknown [Prunus dulcis]
MAGLWGQSIHHVGPNPSISRSNSLNSSSSSGSGCYYNSYMELSSNNYTMMEKRQLFLRSYQFSRKKSLTERIKGSFCKAKKVIWLRLRSARKLRKLVCFRLRYGLAYRRRRLCRLLNNYHHTRKCNNSYCFW